MRSAGYPRLRAVPGDGGDSSGSKAGALQSLFREYAFEQHFQPRSTILLHGDPADAIYRITSGTARCCTLDTEGHRQIFSFVSKGRMLGISDIDHWHFTAEAVDNVVLQSLPRRKLEAELAVNAQLRLEVAYYLRDLLVEREQQLLALSTKSAPDRLYRFLEAYAADRPSNSYVALPMSRSEIGDHIGLSMESVSRAFGELKRAGKIDLKSFDRFKIGAAQRHANAHAATEFAEAG